VSRVIVGIDPGLTGAIAILDGDSLTIHDMPVVATKAGRRQVSPHLLRDLLEPLVPFNLGGGLLAVVEDVHAMPKQGVSSVFSFGQSLGSILGVLAGLYVPYRLVSPQAWMSRAGVKKTASGDKVSRTRAIELFPAHANLFNLKKHHGRADAALMAWAERNQQG
jgi:crossover junction endodeoxyribonuclease RuvC